MLWREQQIPENWTHAYFVLYRKSDKIDCTNYHGIMLFKTALSSIRNNRLKEITICMATDNDKNVLYAFNRFPVGI